ncbi:MAG: cobalt-precorrin 5A hydrolase [Peptostreptococcaceae bacterium]|nr:cobalt-precorrin 5A hydrolase [Peptostreptococcaceae bacterium]MDY5738900.1 cobalt-precorrin 5A hydrolase [Anaerovoracaceae bacterium]
MKTLSIIAFTKRGKNLRSKLVEKLSQLDKFEVDIPLEGQNQRDFVRDNFNRRDGFIFIGASGIAVRYIAPLIKSKDVDPAVVLLDEFGRYSISLLSGHLGGANELAEEIAQLIDAEPIITTATDINEKFAVDVWSKYVSCHIVDISMIKRVSAEILEGNKVAIYSGFPFEGEMPDELTIDPRPVGICVSFNSRLKPFEETFNLVPKIITLGVGCRKNTGIKAFEKFILSKLDEEHIDINAIEKIASIDLKNYEPCILEFSKKYGIPFITATADELNEVEGIFDGSDFVKKTTGVDNVCERSAVKFSDKGKIILSKQSQGGMTMALAMKDWKCKF